MLADPLGLTEKDIKMMLCFARTNNNAATSYGKKYENLVIPLFDELKFKNMNGKHDRI